MIADQLVRTEVLDVTKSFLVQAPAGSGKTSLLVQRVLCLLATVQQAPEEILAITFTRKAAAEMRSRILDALLLGKSGEPTDNYQRQLWLLAQPVLARDQQENWNLLNNPNRLKIQTIDALCASITAQMPITSQFGSQPQVEPNAENLYIKAVDRLLQEDRGGPPWPPLNILLSHLDNDRIKTRNLLIAMLGIREQWLPIVVNNLSQHDIREQLEDALEQAVFTIIEDLTAAVPEVLNFKLLPVQQPESHTDWLEIAQVLLTKDYAWRKQVTEAQGFPAPSKSKDPLEKAQLKANKDAMHVMLEKLAGYEIFKQLLITVTKLPPIKYTDLQWQVISALAVVLRMLVAQLTLVFKDTGQVDFTAVTLAALQALGSGDNVTDLSLALDCKIQHILVDEFQDTSLVQYALLEKLTANWDNYAGKSLFLVGDPMQSIYRFRKAEVGLFLRAKYHGINNITLNFVQLTVNFRASAELIAELNSIFLHSFPDLDNITYGAISYMPAQAAKNNINNKQAIQWQAVADNAEIEQIVDIVKNIKDNPDGHNKSIAILVRAKSHVKYLLPALRAANIAYQDVDLENISERPVTQDLLALTKAILHLDDRIAWLAILRAPWCGLYLTDLQVIADANGTIWQALNTEKIINNLSTDGQLRVARLINIMNATLQQTGRKPLSWQVQTAWQLLNPNKHLETDSFFDLLTDLGNKREIYTLGFLEQQLEKLCLPSTNADPQAVQIMTMHKAKGLEFDVVILPSLNKTTRHADSQLLLIDHNLIAPIKAADQAEDLIYKYLAWTEQQRQAYEDLRLLYVAMTRARQQIYCLADVSQHGPKEKSLLGKIWPAVSKNFVTYVNQPEITTVTQVQLNNIQRLPSAWYVNNNYIIPEINTVDVADINLNPWADDWVRLVGVVAHRIFYNIANDGIENWDQARLERQKPVWQQHLRQLGVSQQYYSQALVLVEQAVNNIMQDPVGRKFLSADYPESYAEWQLTVSERGEFKTMILDRAFLDHNGVFWIVDYKIVKDSSEVAVAKEKYSGQLYKYITAVKKLKPSCKIMAGLYFPLQQEWWATPNF